MHIKLIIKLMSVMAFILSIFLLPSFFTAITYDSITTVYAFAVSILLLLIPALIGYICTYSYKSKYVTIKDGFLLVTISWLSISFYAATPYFLSGTFTSWADCFFEAVSGITTTGATVIQDVELSPKAILLWRSITHWLGGVGVVVLSVALLPVLGIGGLQLLKAEASGLDGTDSRKITSRVAQTAKLLWIIYISFTFTSFIMLKIGGMNTFDAINHAMSAMSSGGFSTKNESIAFYKSSYIDWVIIVSMFMAGTNFSIFFLLLSGKFKEIIKNTEFKLYLFIIFFFGIFITFINFITTPEKYTGLLDSSRYAFFQVVSVMTTTGFSTEDYELWPYVCQFLLLILLFTGGCAGSTSGGFKVIRFAVLIKQALNEIRHIMHPRGVFLIRLNGTALTKEVVYSVFAFFFLYLSTVTVVAFIMTTNTDMLTSISGSLAMVTNAGPGFGMTGPTHNYAHFPGYIKYVLSVAMLIGRLEIYTFFAILTPYFWRKFR